MVEFTEIEERCDGLVGSAGRRQIFVCSVLQSVSAAGRAVARI